MKRVSSAGGILSPTVAENSETKPSDQTALSPKERLVDDSATKPATHTSAAAASLQNEPKKVGETKTSLANAFQMFDAALYKRGMQFDLEAQMVKRSGTINQNGILVSYMPLK